MLKRGHAPLIIAALLVACSSEQAGQPAALTDEIVRDVHANARPADAHSDILVSTTPEIYRTDDGESQLTLDKLAAGGMAIQVLALQSPNGPDSSAGVAAAREEIDAKLATVHAIVAAFPDQVGLARSVDEIDALNMAGRIAIVLGFQNAYGLGSDIALVGHYVAEGVRVFAFNHAGNNAFSDSSRPSPPGATPNSGLSEIGREAVRRLNDHGVVIDVSQLTSDAVLQTVELSRAPVLATHSAVRVLADETRNLLDHEMDAIAAGGGAVCIPPFNTYLAPRPPEFVERLGDIRAEYGLPREFAGVLDDSNLLEGALAGEYAGRALASVPRATLDDYVRHIDYVVERVGIDHVCIGTDFDHGAGIIGYADASEAQNLTRALLEAGYGADDVAKIWSGNFLRVLRAAESAATD